MRASSVPEIKGRAGVRCDGRVHRGATWHSPGGRPGEIRCHVSVRQGRTGMVNKTRLAATSACAVLIMGVVGGYGPSAANADPRIDWTSVPANQDLRGFTAPNVLSPQLREVTVAEGANRLENPTDTIGFYGYNSNGSHVADPTLVQSPGRSVEANKTEPDKNTYLRLPGLHGADPHYHYGTHFLYQGHETGIAGYVTRINLDADQ